jgi:hypothetical protein
VCSTHTPRTYPKQNKRVRSPSRTKQKQRPDSRKPSGNKLYCISCQWTVVNDKCSVSCYDPNFTFANFHIFNKLILEFNMS